VDRKNRDPADPVNLVASEEDRGPPSVDFCTHREWFVRVVRVWGTHITSDAAGFAEMLDKNVNHLVGFLKVKMRSLPATQVVMRSDHPTGQH
jgi:hypothetical protein